ncbi:MAG TPA: conjugative transposon protein TraM [Puia sp.]|nr:conjugative transposon protein TraM [Puia sp.]
MTSRKKLLQLPVIVVPFLCFMFYSLGGGKGAPGPQKADSLGFNTELPGARFDKQEQARTKLDFYKQADQDSIRRREYQRQDPNFQKTRDSSRHRGMLTEDHKADELLQRLDRLNQSIQQQPSAAPVIQHAAVLPPLPVRGRPHAERRIDTVEEDPQLEKLNTMLDKIIRIQHPAREEGSVRPASEVVVVPDTVAANSLPAVTQENQVLVAGATIALRLTAEVRINGVSFPKDQLLYGVVSISNDRMLVAINSIRREQGIYPVGLQVYDLDGLPGIHIPGSLGRETVKQSADQSINSMGLVGLEALPMAQVTNAGVMTARSLLSRKVRLLRVTVPAGYRVLLRNSRVQGKIQVAPERTMSDSVGHVPEPGVFEPFLHRVVRHEKMELLLQGIYLRDSLLWIVLRLENHSPIGYMPGYVRWCIRDKRRGRRTAFQELAVTPLYSCPVGVVEGDSSRVMMAGFRPFALPKDKELVLLVAEGNGARELVMTIGEKELLKLQRYEQE